MIVVQLSDLHINVGGPSDFGRDSLAAAQAAVDRLAALDPRPDVVVVTGDTSRSRDGYLAAKRMLDATGIAYFLIPGNHDDREVLVDVFGLPTTPGGFVQYVVDDYELRLIALDSRRDDSGDGLLCDERLRWLEQALDEAPGRPTMLLLHHPPVRTGLWWFDGPGLEGADRLGELVRRHPNVVCVACGHVHRHASARWSGTIVHIAPATCWSASLDLGDERPPRAVFEAPAFLVHALIDGEVVTHRVSLGESDPPTDVDLMGGWENMRAFMVALKASRS